MPRRTATPSLDLDAAAGLARLLADPTRLRVLDYLVHHGGAGVSEVAIALDIAGPRLSNHLAKLRTAGLVDVRRNGRHVVYEIADPSIVEVIASLLSVPVNRNGHGRASRPASVRHDVASVDYRDARSCYDHVAGRLGVQLLEALQHHGALRSASSDGEAIELGGAADEVFARLGVDVASLARQRRRLAFACLDSTERRPHLGGAAGRALLDSFVDRDWLDAEPTSRVLRLTAAGKRGLARTLDVRV